MDEACPTPEESTVKHGLLAMCPFLSFPEGLRSFNADDVASDPTDSLLVLILIGNFTLTLLPEP